MINQDLIKIFEEFSFFSDIHREPFKKRAYDRVIESLESLGQDVKDLYRSEGRTGLFKISGVGEGISDKIEEYLKKGTVAELEKLKKKFPVDIHGLTAIEGVGPKAVKVLWEKLKIKNVADLKRAAEAGKIQKLKRFGKRSEEKILRGIEFLEHASGRQILGFLIPTLEDLRKKIARHPAVERAIIAGSVRRMKETIGDIDILAISEKPKEVGNFFTHLPDVARVLSVGETKTNVTLRNGLDADMRVVPKKSFGAALNYFTGSKDHNVYLRQLASKKGWKLNEYGLFDGTRQIAGDTEESIYKTLDLQYIPPEVRENSGEIELSAKGYDFSNIIDYRDVRGDLQVQTNWTDGSHSIEEMAEAALAVGLSYIAITDHTKTLAMTGGSDEKKLCEQMKAIDLLNEKFSKKGFRILKGAEVNILKDGTLDIEDAVLKQLDVVGVAVHSHFSMSRAEMTKRIVRAMQNSHTDILFHPTGRIIQKREPYDFDFDEILHVAKETGTVLEIDCYPSRSDLKDEHIRRAMEHDVLVAIDSDAHHRDHFEFLHYGVGLARRGWAKKKNVVNARSCDEMLGMLKH